MKKVILALLISAIALSAVPFASCQNGGDIFNEIEQSGNDVNDDEGSNTVDNTEENTNSDDEIIDQNATTMDDSYVFGSINNNTYSNDNAGFVFDPSSLDPKLTLITDLEEINGEELTLDKLDSILTNNTFALIAAAKNDDSTVYVGIELTTAEVFEQTYGFAAYKLADISNDEFIGKLGGDSAEVSTYPIADKDCKAVSVKETIGEEEYKTTIVYLPVKEGDEYVYNIVITTTTDDEMNDIIGCFTAKQETA